MENQPFSEVTVGIDDISVYIPKIYLPIRQLAQQRDIDPDKLEKGLGLINMAVPDVGEDAVTMAAEAVLELIKKNDLLPGSFQRIYVGTESMVDGSKPIASYVLGIIKKYYDSQGISTSSLNQCDVVDMTFACIGATDALQNSLDWIRVNPSSQAIIVASDWAKYDLGSPGEYTQGAGAIAMLVSAEPRLLSIENKWGISAQCEHDFYKPIRRSVNRDDLTISNGIDKSQLANEIIYTHKDTPVYDGQFSNQCYRDRITEAYQHYVMLAKQDKPLLEYWDHLVFHLPYAFHARRMFSEIYMSYLQDSDQWIPFLQNNQLEELVNNQPKSSLLKWITKTPVYRDFVRNKIEKGERASSDIGNVYTASIFISLISTLEGATQDQIDINGHKIGFFAYGSGSKAKVFSGIIQSGYAEIVERIKQIDRLNNRNRISFVQYEYRHQGKLITPIDPNLRQVFHQSSGWMPTNIYARNYGLA